MTRMTCLLYTVALQQGQIIDLIRLDNRYLIKAFVITVTASALPNFSSNFKFPGIVDRLGDKGCSSPVKGSNALGLFSDIALGLFRNLQCRYYKYVVNCTET
jgi:hypothetical protein